MHEYLKMWRFRQHMQNREKLYINGKWVIPDGKAKIEIINPTNEENIGYVPAGSTNDIDMAVESAKQAFKE